MNEYLEKGKDSHPLTIHVLDGDDKILFKSVNMLVKCLGVGVGVIPPL